MAKSASESGEGVVGLIRRVVNNAINLAKLDLQLAKAQVQATKNGVIIAIAFLAAAIFGVFLTIIFALATIPVGLGSVLFPDHQWLAWLFMALLLGLVTAALGWGCWRIILRTQREVMATLDSIKEDIAFIKEEAQWPFRSNKPDKSDK